MQKVNETDQQDQVDEEKNLGVPRVETKPTSELSAAPSCVWYKDDWDENELWETDCGQTFQFNDGGPKENSFRFCYFCGKPLEELRRSESDEIDAPNASYQRTKGIRDER